MLLEHTWGTQVQPYLWCLRGCLQMSPTLGSVGSVQRPTLLVAREQQTVRRGPGEQKAEAAQVPASCVGPAPRCDVSSRLLLPSHWDVFRQLSRVSGSQTQTELYIRLPGLSIHSADCGPSRLPSPWNKFLLISPLCGSSPLSPLGNPEECSK